MVTILTYIEYVKYSALSLIVILPARIGFALMKDTCGLNLKCRRVHCLLLIEGESRAFYGDTKTGFSYC